MHGPPGAIKKFCDCWLSTRDLPNYGIAVPRRNDLPLLESRQDLSVTSHPQLGLCGTPPKVCTMYLASCYLNGSFKQ